MVSYRIERSYLERSCRSYGILHRTVIGTLAVVLFLLHGGLALAQDNDKEMDTLVSGVLADEFKKGQFGPAQEKLEVAKQVCSSNGCSAKMRARVLVALGAVLAGQKKDKEAKESFAAAFKEDANAQLPDGVPASTKELFDAAKSGDSKPADTKPADVKPADPKKDVKYCKKGARIGKGFRNIEASCAFDLAKKSETQQKWGECVDAARASVGIEDTSPARLLAATCLDRAGRLRDAIAELDALGTTEAKSRARDIAARVPKIVIRKPTGVERLLVKLDGELVAPEKLGSDIWVDAGSHVVHASAVVGGQPTDFEEKVELGESERVEVTIQMRAAGAQKDAFDPRLVSVCMTRSKTRDDFARCVARGGQEVTPSPFNVRASGEISAYFDTDHVEVLTPGATFAVEDPVGGWGLSGSMLVDVVTAASADVVANASPRWTEVRYAPAIGAHKRAGDWDLHFEGSLSHEPDYLATSVGGGVSVDLRNKTVTPSLTYDFGYDISGRAGTPFSVYSHKIIDHAITGGVTFVVDKATIFVPTATVVLETGDTSKPYRYIPTFTAENASKVVPGETAASLAAVRAPERMLEQLPSSRQRYALSGLLAHRYSASTLRFEERIYIDSWGLKATTTNLRLSYDIGTRWRIAPELRFHGQLPVTFWHLAYVTERTADGIKFPEYRTGDRELGPLGTGSLGLGLRRVMSKTLALTLNGEVDYTRFLDDLYIKQRIAVFGALTAEVGSE